MGEPATFERERASAERERASAGTRGWRKPGAAAEIQVGLDLGEASLTEDLKQGHPVRSLDQIGHDHPNRWVALLPTKVGHGLGVAAGRVLAEAADRASIRDRIDALRRANPRLTVVAYYAGPASSDRASDDGSA